MPKDVVYIYALVDPLTQKARYVGQSSKPESRFNEHIRSAKNGKTYSAKWINSLLLQDLRPELAILEEITSTEADTSEVWWIAYLKSLGCHLTNHTIGGESTNGTRGFKHPPEFGRNIAKRQLGTKLSELHRENCSKAHLGIKFSESRKLNMSKAQKISWKTNHRRKSNSGYIGVSKDKSTNTAKPWKAYITVNRKLVNIGRFHTALEAAIAYDNEAMRCFGTTACLNFGDINA